MEAVYGNAALVIAATSAGNGKGGLFLQKAKRYELCITEASGATYNLRARSRAADNHHAFLMPHIYLSDLPLLYRGWAFEERVLAPRIIHFCKEELIWECGSTAWCECSSISPDSRTSMVNLRKVLKIGAQSMIEIWFGVLEAYTRCQLTYTSDRLVAISSIAQRFQDKSLGHYLAGIWQHNFIFGLQWRTISWVRGPQKPSLPEMVLPIYVPSWSWASVSHAVGQADQRSRDKRYKDRAEVLDVYCLPQNPKAPYGNLIKAELTLRGYLLPAIYD